MSSAWEYYLTPTLTLSLLLACEAPRPTLSSWFASWALYLARPALLRQTLEWDLEQEGGTAGVTGTVGAGTLRVVDYARWKALRGEASSASASTNSNGYTRLSSAVPGSAQDTDDEEEDLSRLIASLEGIDVPSPAHDLLLSSLSTVRRTYALTAAAVARAETPFPEEGSSAEPQLRELWRLLRPERGDLRALKSKEWQEVGFQLDAFLHFARTYGDRAAEMVDESVGGGEHWYPLALASIHVTAFVLDMAKNRDLQLYLLRSLPPPSVDTNDNSPSPTSSPSPPSLDPLLSLSSSLLTLFHAFWLSHQPRPNVMQFESIFRDFEARMRPWVRRGVVDGRALGWSDQNEGALKLE
ncbi:hypothetical protein DMC30DRAFT_417474 [Rhodotorula diobovata]|uniref:ELMO domain-containing protein n=1 Tax=Rhodotorula diobovata TaxID=5288 RepID=A0A5C5FUN8_9BASI|nr:hypothetical protein DMC30DRAFT_417474 [Rhodotorula diobovata]